MLDFLVELFKARPNLADKGEHARSRMLFAFCDPTFNS